VANDVAPHVDPEIQEERLRFAMQNSYEAHVDAIAERLG